MQLVIPYPPGGSDALSRKLIIGMSEQLGQPIVVVNKPGASTQIATQMVVSSSPDGHILYMSSPGELAAGPALFKSLPFNALTDLTPISYVAEAPYTLIAASSLPVKTYAELVAFLKANPDKARFGTYGVQTQPDILARRFNRAIGVDVQIVPYQGGSPAFNAMLRGEVNLIFATLIPTRSFISAGQMVPLAIAADKRVKALSRPANLEGAQRRHRRCCIIWPCGAEGTACRGRDTYARGGRQGVEQSGDTQLRREHGRRSDRQARQPSLRRALPR